jgi:glycosyltransferase involved in cell wall biosynthesis/SAM-dependent methyltransferase
MPPSRSGIADYSEALVSELGKLVSLEVFDRASKPFNPAQFDAILYHLGNNPHHDFVYRAALRHPGVLVLHESNLHHLIAHLTIVAGDWDAYVAEAEYNGGEEARKRAEKARSLTVGPDYDGVTMTRRVLESAKGVIVHSDFMARELRNGGYKGPLGRIPHGAWMAAVDGAVFRATLGLDSDTPLVGAFGFLKPYKRIAESLRAFRRVVRDEPRAKMILVGEPHPEFPLDSLIRSLGLQSHVRVLGFTPIEDFAGYIAACDIVLNLRFPTLGESSGSLLRALGLGRAVLVSDVGSFSEFPDDICLKVPVGAGEEEILYEYLRLLTARPDLARAMGARAKEWVARECNWSAVAGQYETFLQTLVPPPEKASRVSAEYIMDWVPDEAARQYIETHRARLVRTLDVIPAGGPDEAVLEMGAYMQITPALKMKLGYGYVRGCYFGNAGRVDHRAAVSQSGERFECDIDLFDAERDPFPYADASFDTVVCGELIEHLFQDPMFLMSEVNRILKTGGHLVLTTPNICSLRGVSAILQGFHPGFFHAYIKPSEDGTVDARHNREYAPGEVYRLLLDAGFEVTLIETGPFGEEAHPEHEWAWDVLKERQLPMDLRGEGIYAVGRKVSGVLQRWPDWLYS